MEKIIQNALQKLSFDRFSTHLEVIANMLGQSDDIALVFKREGDQVLVYYHRMYNERVDDIVDEARREHQRKNSQGYSREQAFADFMLAQMAMRKYPE